MKKSFLLFMLLINPFFSLSAENFHKVVEIYGIKNLSEKPAFQGGYINFGYWKNIGLKKKTLSQEERILASKQLYDLVIQELNITKNDRVLEVGCGLGNGCIDILQSCHPEEIVGIDLTPQQIIKAKNRHRAHLNSTKALSFINAPAHHTPFFRRDLF
jgi:SAM-dependent methyltransferase